MTDRSLGIFPDTHLISQRSTWYQALTFAERLVGLHAAGEVPEAGNNLELAERRLRKWKAQPPFDKETYFADRLALDGASEEDLLTLLGESIEAVQARTKQPPEWLLTLTQAFAIFDRSERVEGSTLKWSKELISFLDPIAPLLKYGVRRLSAGIETQAGQHTFLPFDKETIGYLLFSHVVNQILSVMVKSLTLELNIARLQEKLQGETAVERFQSFIQQLCEPGAMLGFLERYPVLARLLVTLIDQGVAYDLELLGHLCSDWSEIRAVLAPEHDPGLLVEIQFGSGDTHRQGRSVAVLTFQSGFKLLYKPRSLAIDTHFQMLISWLNERGAQPALRAVQVLDKGSYGWSEYVQAHGCASAEEMECFYKRLGGYLALTYALEGSDLHHENVMASGEYPMLVDLETLIQPHLRRQTSDPKLALPHGLVVLQTSVMQLSLLPQRVWSNPDGESVDISGLGSTAGQLTPRPISMLEAPGTDQMRYVRQRVVMPERQNRPTLDGANVDIQEYLDQVCAGFKQIYCLLITHREELFAQILPLFAHDQIRIVLRPTQNYMRILEESLHPTTLGNALDRDRLFDRLWIQIPGNLSLSRVIRAETEDLRENNVPIFTTFADDRSLLTSREERLDHFFDESGMAMVKQRIQQLDEQDLARQLWIIQASFATKMIGDEQQVNWKKPQLRQINFLQEGEELVLRERLLQAACAVGDRLCELAIHGENEISWLTLQLVKEREWSIFITSLDLYSGAAGIGLFLAYLGAATGEKRYTTLARQIAETIHHHTEQITDDILSAGAFNGWGGLIYLYTHLAALWQDQHLLSRAEGLVERFVTTIETDEQFDILGGIAGGISALLTLYRVSPSARTLSVAVQCGDHLLAHATTMPTGIGWLTPIAQKQPLTGYSHGAAGIALSLLELGTVSGEERFRSAALAAMEYERSVFVPTEQNWPDLRDRNAEEAPNGSYMVAWCHGAPGIGLARLASLAYIDNAIEKSMIHKEIEIAVKTTLAQGFHLNHCLCHGDLGNLDLLLTASQTLDDASYRREVARLAAQLLESIERQGWSTGVPLSVETPGLMTGIAGIGYELLRLARPDQVPSVLSLASPCYGSDQMMIPVIR